jgi:DNA-binding GntR family transcriptional regulator
MSRRQTEAPKSRQTAVDRAVEGIRERLLTGYYAPGQRLVEVDLVEELGVGRNSVREALTRLASEGVVRIEPHRGASVRRLSEAELEDLYAVRAVLEGLAARLAATHIGERGKATRLRKARTAMRRAARAGDLAGYMDENLAFHACIVELAGNTHLTEMVGQLHLQAFRVQFQRRGFKKMLEYSPREHDEIAEAILAGDGERAETLMRAHLQHTESDTLKLVRRRKVPS